MTTTSAIRLRQVSAAYGATRHLPIDLSIPAGARVWISGVSGVGKTSLLYVMGALALARGGDVEVGGIRVTSEREAIKVRRQKVAFVLQDAQLVDHWSIRRNLLNAVGEAGIAAADEAGDRLASWGLPAGTEQPRALSGGERQRVVVAGALARRSPVLIVDEPTSSLDEASRDLIMSAFSEAADAGAAVVVSSHDPIWGGWATNRVRLDGERP